MTRATLPEAHADAPEPPERRSGELTVRELGRWGWRQLTSMRTALVLLLLLALAAIPGSVIPQSGVDSLKTARWQSDHPDLTPIYEKLQLFSVYDSPWFAAIYLMLMVSLVGCIIPRLLVYWRALRAQPPAAPRHLDRLPVHTSYVTDDDPQAVLDRAVTVLRERHYRVLTGSRDGRQGALLDHQEDRRQGALLDHRRAPSSTTRTGGWRPSGGTCARRATCCSTWRSWWCWSGSPSGGSSATRAA